MYHMSTVGYSQFNFQRPEKCNLAFAYLEANVQEFRQPRTSLTFSFCVQKKKKLNRMDQSDVTLNFSIFLNFRLPH